MLMSRVLPVRRVRRVAQAPHLRASPGRTTHGDSEDEALGRVRPAELGQSVRWCDRRVGTADLFLQSSANRARRPAARPAELGLQSSACRARPAPQNDRFTI